MTVLVGPDTDRRERSVRRLVTWSWAMLPLVLLSVTAAELLGQWAMSALGVPEGELLWNHGTGAVLTALALLALVALPPAVGTWLGARARRLGGGPGAMAAWAVNLGLLVVLTVPSLLQAVLA